MSKKSQKKVEKKSEKSDKYKKYRKKIIELLFQNSDNLIKKANISYGNDKVFRSRADEDQFPIDMPLWSILIFFGIFCTKFLLFDKK